MKRNYPLLARVYLDLQRLRIAIESRLRILAVSQEDMETYKILSALHSRLLNEEKKWLKQIMELAKEHPIWEYCQKVKGMGAIAAVTFLGFIDPYKAVSAGKVWSYFGYAPSQKLRAGQKASFNTEAKGRAWLITRNVIMHKDPYYTPLYKKKKAYYMEKMGAYITNPQLCPKYEECKKKLMAKAKRLGREPKNFPCKKHIDSMARRWLTKLILSHALQIMREAEGLDTENLKSHRGYIPPPL
jgi:hypothetical protein